MMNVETAPHRDSTETVRAGGCAPGPMSLPRVDRPGGLAPRDAKGLSKVFLQRLQVLEEGTAEFQYAWNTLIEMNLSLVKFAAGRFRNRGGGEMEDIIQVGTIGLIKAVDRFDLSRETEFTSFAMPCITGEIKRYFRDSSWAVHVPRRLQELRVELAKAREELGAVLDRDPTPKELAGLLEISEDDVREGLIAANAYIASSLDTPNADHESSGAPSAAITRSYADLLGDDDPAMELAEDLHTLAPLLEDLGERDRRILRLRFGQEMTQAQIGKELGLSQMHVSRLLSRTLGRLRKAMLTDR